MTKIMCERCTEEKLEKDMFSIRLETKGGDLYSGIFVEIKGVCNECRKNGVKV